MTKPGIDRFQLGSQPNKQIFPMHIRHELNRNRQITLIPEDGQCQGRLSCNAESHGEYPKCCLPHSRIFLTNEDTWLSH